MLVVDDDLVSRELLANALATMGCSTRTADNGLHALELLQPGGIDLVLLDVNMPGLDGMATLTAIRKQYTPLELPVIMITSLGSSDDVVQALSAGANDFITKPAHMDIVGARVRTQTALRAAHLELRRRDEKMAAEIDIAGAVHSSMLPGKLPASARFTCAVTYRPMTQIGGDFYDVIPQREPHRQGLIFADLCGHGVAGALLTSLFKVQVHECLAHHDDAVEGWYRLDQRVAAEFPEGRFATAIYFILDHTAGTVQWLCSAPEPVVLIGANGTIRELTHGGSPLGFAASAGLAPPRPVLQQEIPAPGDLLFAFTDGLTDAADAQGRRLTTHDLLQWLRDAQSSPNERPATAAALLDAVTQRMTCFVGDADPADDISLLAIRCS